MEENKKVKINKTLILTIVMLLALVFALSQLDHDNLLYSISKIPIWSVIVLILLQIISVLLVNIQWYQIAQVTKINISFRNIFFVNSQGYIIDFLARIGGEIARAVQLKELGNCSQRQAIAMLLLQKIFSLSAYFAILLFALGYLLSGNTLTEIVELRYVIYSIIIIILILFACLLFFPSQIKKYLLNRKAFGLKWLSSTYGFIIILLEQVENLWDNKIAWLRLALLSIVIWLVYAIQMYVLAIQMMPEVQFIYIAAITFVSYMVATIPIFPGGLGGFEGTMTALLFLAGFAMSDAAIITILFRFTTFWLLLLIGLVYVTLYKATNKKYQEKEKANNNKKV